MNEQQGAEAAPDDYRTLVEGSREGIFRLDAGGVLVFANRRSAEILGYDDPAEILGRHFGAFIAEEDLPQAQQSMAQRRLGEAGINEYRMRRKDGRLAWLGVSSVPVMDAGGAFLGVTGFVRDIGELKRREAFNTQKLRLLRRIAGDAPLAEVLDDLCLTLESLASRPLRCSVMIADAELDSLSCLAAPSMPEAFRLKAAYTIRDGTSTCARAICSGRPVIVADALADAVGEEVLALRREQGYRAIWSHPILQDGQALGTLAFLPDTPGTPGTQDTGLIEFGVELARLALLHERHERALRESEQRFRDYAEMSADWYWEQGADFRFTEVKYGPGSRPAGPPYYDRDVVGRHRWELPYVNVPEGFWQEHRRLLEAGRPFPNLRLQRRTEAGIRHIEISGRPLFDEAGRLTGYRGVGRDITEQERAEAQVREFAATLEDRVKARTAELEAANQELDAFNYSVSHDLRAPLRAVQGFSQALLEDHAAQLDEAGRDYLSRIDTAAQRMGRLIDALYHLSKLSRALLQVRELSLTALAEAVLEELSQAEPARAVEADVARGLTAEGDPDLLRIVFANLLGNAWKYTARAPGPRIEFGADADAEGNRVFFVRDNGAGFDMQFADKLFKLFQRLHREEEFGGHGVGLATVQRILRRHGGRIWAESEKGRGTTFYFTLWENAALRRDLAAAALME